MKILYKVHGNIELTLKNFPILKVIQLLKICQKGKNIKGWAIESVVINGYETRIKATLFKPGNKQSKEYIKIGRLF